nr:PREDICTED: uncharacterized protein LOC102349116 [Latimeria chalumnae]|eukprot:XP_014349316.1 PREDICTED: uncharacterized protein LOC102349116 [Latimeria chalumnae]
MSGMGTATQSSVYKIGIAKHAIDGNKNGNHRKLSCSHTRADKSPWWRLDLQTTRTIMTVVITNRADCCSNRLRNVEVRVGNSLQNEGRDNYKCVPEKSATLPGATVRFCCYGASGRYVTVFIPNRREFLTLCEVEVFGILPYSSLQNIARMGTATQSSAYKNGIAKHAIDGNKNGNHRKLSCSHTRADRSPWWRLDLQTTRTIMTVVITNRADCCSNRLRNVEVRVGNSLQNEGRDNYKCVPEKSVTLPGATVRFCCYGASGRYVTVFIPNRREFLTLCEVEVFGILPYSSLQNIARMGTATQSSEYKTGLAKHAIDGNKNTNHRQLSCSHTKADKSPWWRLDLQTTRTIMTVVLTNRVDCCSNRLRNVEVRVGNSLKNKGRYNYKCLPEYSVILPGATVGFCCYGASGRYVTVFIPNRREFLTLCEVEVFGILPYLSLTNMALMGTATQSSLYGSIGVAQLAIDGNNDSNYRARSCTRTKYEKDPWWRLDLKDSRAVIKVVLTTRSDCCTSRMKGVQIRVGDSLENEGRNNFQCTPEKSVDSPEVTMRFCCNGVAGRYVTVFTLNRKNFLSICELEVFGYGSCVQFPGEKNVALTSEVMQSSLNDMKGIPEHAIDGNRKSHYSSLSCLYTQKEQDPWFRIDLREMHKVSAVTITNRADCCWNNLKGAEIHIGNSLKKKGLKNPMCAKINKTSPGYTESFCCDGMLGRFVTINIPGRQDFLTLCEVEVFGIPVPCEEL